MLITGNEPREMRTLNDKAFKLIEEYNRKKEACLARTNGVLVDDHWAARTEGTSNAQQIVDTFNDREMAGLYLAEYHAIATSVWEDGCKAQPQNRRKWPLVAALLREATQASKLELVTL